VPPYDQHVFRQALFCRAQDQCVTPRDVAEAYREAAPHFAHLFVTEEPGSWEEADRFLLDHMVPALAPAVQAFGLRVVGVSPPSMRVVK